MRNAGANSHRLTGNKAAIINNSHINNKSNEGGGS